MIEKNLREDITIREIAKGIGFSYYYYNHLFKAITGVSPSTYLNQRRLADSVNLLMTSDKKILDIALVYGYSSSEAYSRAFVRIFNQTPSSVRKEGLVNGEYMLKPLVEGEALTEGYVPYRESELVELEEIQLVGLSFYYDFNSNKNDLTDQYNHLISEIKKIKGVKYPWQMYQMQYWFEHQKSDSVYIYIAVEVEYYDTIPFYLTQKRIPQGQYLKFYHKGLANQVSKTYNYIYKEWLPRTDYRLPYNFCFEHYGKESLGPYNPNSVSEIYIPVKKGEA